MGTKYIALAALLACAVLSPAAASETLWTAQDLKLFCDDRWKSQPDAIKDCLQRNQRKIERPMTPGEIQEMNHIRDKLPKKPDKKN